MGWTILAVVVIGVLAVAGACVVALVVWGWWWMRTSPHAQEASRLEGVVKTNAAYGGEASATALRAFDELVELTRRYPSEPLPRAFVFQAAAHGSSALRAARGVPAAARAHLATDGLRPAGAAGAVSPLNSAA